MKSSEASQVRVRERICHFFLAANRRSFFFLVFWGRFEKSLQMLQFLAVELSFALTNYYYISEHAKCLLLVDVSFACHDNLQLPVAVSDSYYSCNRVQNKPNYFVI